MRLQESAELSVAVIPRIESRSSTAITASTDLARGLGDHRNPLRAALEVRLACVSGRLYVLGMRDPRRKTLCRSLLYENGDHMYSAKEV